MLLDQAEQWWPSSTAAVFVEVTTRWAGRDAGGSSVGHLASLDRAWRSPVISVVLVPATPWQS